MSLSISNSVTAKRQKGTTLLEVLISVLVLSIGLLGVAGLQTYGLRYNQSAYLRSQATILAYDMVDRMRSNSSGVAAGYYNSVSTATLPTDPNCISTGCTNLELANHDIREWANYFVGTQPVLPSANGSVSRNGSIFTVNVSWTELDKAGTTNQSVSYNFRL
ncbi:Type IV fimbrial biogenesis protein PilV [hydrothermal vent metagenome]|uniref:Type IV fimbrial biogenesis protein PilV n=1 Tax=hydrothermal vent metagenome TaxID=652676 RepID=A0A3B0XZR3_9ZZZZ